MIKGCNKRVIVMKDTGSDMIEEAFFILRPSKDKALFSEADIIKHANSILEKSRYAEGFDGLNMSVRQNKKKSGPSSFILGLAFGILLSSILFLVI